MSEILEKGILEQENMAGNTISFPTYLRMVKIHKELQSVKEEYVNVLKDFCVDTGLFSGEIHIEGVSEDMSCAIEGVLEGRTWVVAMIGNHYDLPFHTEDQINHVNALHDKVTILDVLNFILYGTVSTELKEMLRDEWLCH